MAKRDAMGDKFKRNFPVAGILIIIGLIIFAAGFIWAKNTDMEKYYDVRNIDETYAGADIKSVELELAVGELEVILSGDNDIHIKGENVPEYIYFEADKNEFRVKSRDKIKLTDLGNPFESGFSIGSPDFTLTVELPDKLYKDLSLDMGAGNASISRISCEEAEFDLGVGDLNVKSFTAQKEISVECGTGNVSFTECSLSNADFDCGVGNVEFSGSLTGETSIDCGVGDVDFALSDSEENYVFRGDLKGKYGSGGKNCENEIDVSTGIGNVRFSFDK